MGCFRNFKQRSKAVPTENRKKEIENVVLRILEQNEELNTPAFDIVRYLKEKEQFDIASKPMIDDTTGMLFVDDDNYISDTNAHRLIVINSLLREQNNFVQRRRFIIAHEYGHFVLHKSDAKQYAHRDTSRREALEEKEADYFARCLLMPRNIIDILLNIDYVKEMPYEVRISLIARIFNVTPKKVKQRLEEDLPNYARL